MAFYLSQPKLLVLNIAPIILFCFLFWFIGKSAWRAFLLASIVSMAYSFAEYWKLMSRSETVYAEELLLLSEALEMSERYISITREMLVILALIIVETLLLRFFFRGKPGSIRMRIALSAAAVAVGIVGYQTVYTSEAVYDSLDVWEELNPWFENSQYISRGGLYPFIYSIQYAVPEKPEGYDKDQAEQTLLEYQTDDISEDQEISVISIMFEAFCDLSEYTDSITGQDPYEDYHTLQQESYSGHLFTNIFAGGTIDTERCVLTGFSELTNFRTPSWSYARYFADQGYSINGSHSGYQAFYNRSEVNRNLGFEEYLFLENHYSELYDGIAPDDVLLPEITRICQEQMEQGNAVFSYNVTYQNHGPYSDTEQYFEEEYIPQEGLSYESYVIANNYLSGVADTGEQMLAMADAFRDAEEPVVLLFFGDHKPWLGEQSSVYAELGIDIASDSDQSMYHYYQTEYLVWANDAAKQVMGHDCTGEGPTISPCFLMNVVFELCGWEGPSYMKLTDEVRELTPIVSSNDIFWEKEALVTENELSKTAKEAVTCMRQVQYYLAQDAGGELPQEDK
ncbi:MAG: LTA synthase family protein [Eubacteriales bacterium]|nr:LTA synthase family protein [Eubacteriales bacterium]